MIFSGPTEQRILSWRNFRQTLNAWPADITRVCECWAHAPLTRPLIDFNHIDLWPDAWTLLKNSQYCDLSIALGIYYTLYYSSYSGKDSMSICQYKLDHEHRYANLVYLPEDKRWCNYHVGKSVNNPPPTLHGEPLYSIRFHDIKANRQDVRYAK